MVSLLDFACVLRKHREFRLGVDQPGRGIGCTVALHHLGKRRTSITSLLQHPKASNLAQNGGKITLPFLLSCVPFHQNRPNQTDHHLRAVRHGPTHSIGSTHRPRQRERVGRQVAHGATRGHNLPTQTRLASRSAQTELESSALRGGPSSGDAITSCVGVARRKAVGE